MQEEQIYSSEAADIYIALGPSAADRYGWLVRTEARLSQRDGDNISLELIKCRADLNTLRAKAGLKMR